MAAEIKENSWCALNLRSDIRQRINKAKVVLQLMHPKKSFTLMDTIDELLKRFELQNAEAYELVDKVASKEVEPES